MEILRTADEFAIVPGSARDLACWLRRLAATIFAEGAHPHSFQFYLPSAPGRKFAPASRRRQHARSRALPRSKRAARKSN